MFKKLSPTRLIALSFVVIIIIGSLLLSLPIANQQPGEYINHLFVATSATCVTGLAPYAISEQYTFFGQAVILVLIQIGGLGFLTILMFLLLMGRQRLSLENRMMIQETYNIKTMQHIPKFLKKIFQYTFFFEGSGAILLTLYFSTKYSFKKALGYGVFHSISAFCNAGFDILGDSSLIAYNDNVFVNVVIALLIMAGGLGFIVHMDLQEKIKQGYKKNYSFRKILNTLSLQTKIVLIMTIGLLLLGMITFFFLEYNNSLAGYSEPVKWLISFFQSVTLRTAGFSTISYANLKDATKLVMCIFMFIGGSPAGTAGGVKTVTIALLIAALKSNIQGENDIHIFKRSISFSDVKIALGILLISLSIAFCGLIALSIFENMAFIDLMFETFSAFGTVGITAGITSLLSNVGKIMIIVLMYIGRIGPLTMVLVFTRQRHNGMVELHYPKEDIVIG